MERVQKAIELAVKWHANQFRKEHHNNGCKIPFIVHPMQVMKTVFDWGAGTEDVLSAAACHDILEDTSITDDTLIAAIGNPAYSIVSELTFYDQGFDPRDKPELKDKYLRTFFNKSVEALVIKIADRACNVQDFINGGEGLYAKIYAKKAQPLIDAGQFRLTEIDVKFGNNTKQIVEHVLNELRIAALGA